jgi:hypothetical protein
MQALTVTATRFLKYAQKIKSISEKDGLHWETAAKPAE